MAHITADFVKESSTTTGLGAFVLGGARSPAQTFSAVCSNGDTVHYAISHDTLNQWETGTGTYSSGGNSITRSVVLSSSNGGALVNFSAGTKRVDLVEPAARIVQQVGPVRIGATSFGSGALSFSNLNGISWGLSTDSAGGTITASVGAAAATSLSFGNANGVSFGIAGSTLTASVEGLSRAQLAVFNVTNLTDWTNSAITAQSIVFRSMLDGIASQNSQANVIFRMSGNSIAGQAFIEMQDGATNILATRISFSNANNVSFGFATSTSVGSGLIPILTASFSANVGLTRAQLAVFNVTNLTDWTNSAITAQSIAFRSMLNAVASQNSQDNVIFRMSGNSIAGQALVEMQAGTADILATRISFSNANGVSFGFGTTTSAASGLIPVLTASLAPHRVAVGNLSFASYTDTTAQAAGLIFPLGSFQSSVFSFANVSFAFSGQSLAGIAAFNVFAGTDTLQGYAQHLSFVNANGISWNISTTTFAQFGRFAQIRASAAPQIGLVSHVGGNSVSNVRTLAFSDASNVTWSLSTAANAVTVFGSVAAGGGGGGGFATVSMVSGFSTTSPAITAATDSSLSGSLLAFPQQATGLNSSHSYNNVNFRLSSNTLLGGAFIRFMGGTATAVDAQNFSFVNSFGNSWAFATITAAGFGLIPLMALRAAVAVSAGTSASQFLHSIVLSDSNNVSFGFNGSTLTASASFPAATSFSFANANNVSFGIAGSTVTASASFADPERIGLVSHVGGNQVADVTQLAFSNASNVTWSLSTAANAATVLASVAAGAGVTLDGFTPYDGGLIVENQYGQNSLLLCPVFFQNCRFDRVVMPMALGTSAMSIASTATVSVSLRVGLYSRNGSSLSLMHSTTHALTLNVSGGVNSANYSGLRITSFPWTTTVTEGNYWYGFLSSTNNAGGAIPVRNGMLSQSINSFFGYMGSASNNTMQMRLGNGFYTNTTANLPASIAFSQINGPLGVNSSNAFRPPGLFFQSGTA